MSSLYNLFQKEFPTSNTFGNEVRNIVGEDGVLTLEALTKALGAIPEKDREAVYDRLVEFLKDNSSNIKAFDTKNYTNLDLLILAERAKTYDNSTTNRQLHVEETFKFIAINKPEALSELLSGDEARVKNAIAELSTIPGFDEETMISIAVLENQFKLKDATKTALFGVSIDETEEKAIPQQVKLDVFRADKSFIKQVLESDVANEDKMHYLLDFSIDRFNEADFKLFSEQPDTFNQIFNKITGEYTSSRLAKFYEDASETGQHPDDDVKKLVLKLSGDDTLEEVLGKIVNNADGKFSYAEVLDIAKTDGLFTKKNLYAFDDVISYLKNHLDAEGNEESKATIKLLEEMSTQMARYPSDPTSISNANRPKYNLLLQSFAFVTEKSDESPEILNAYSELVEDESLKSIINEYANTGAIRERIVNLLTGGKVEELELEVASQTFMDLFEVESVERQTIPNNKHPQENEKTPPTH